MALRRLALFVFALQRARREDLLAVLLSQPELQQRVELCTHPVARVLRAQLAVFKS